MKLFAACLLACLPLGTIAAELRLLTDNHPPLHFQQGNELTGFAVDVVRRLGQATGDDVRLERLPLLRALREAQSDEDTAVFTVLRTPEREASYQWVGPLLEVETALYAAPDSTLAIGDLQQAAGVRHIVVPRKWQAYRDLKAQGLGNLYGVDTPEQMMRLLALGRADLVAVDNLSVATLAQAAGLGPLRYQMPLRRQGAYIAFSPQTNQQRVLRWQQALERMRADGQLQRLQQRWLNAPTTSSAGQ
ncbi:substrate-binding periplasmic protein [Pseudomonas rubra]|uniref:Transporter substrate-binding domain-containing protein n=1 Tax=Pseudomonas rubra TaxID=2942627 RepID=A0ABT5P9F0_9PSED|nr:transporter substrate-binding domain-containing protein [Pseudomonas rubra]MDD1014939.1 transporter substrate-binding domain-containing protein [Pseudomonas rubra]MDD1041314.1 transporter substrate-binding domain-containing protein [Pseudomonas rubra]MDD1157805.1 transporter substrate-binding domain-containing protein [Pseudomonas rubra]